MKRQSVGISGLRALSAPEFPEARILPDKFCGLRQLNVVVCKFECFLNVWWKILFRDDGRVRPRRRFCTCFVWLNVLCGGCLICLLLDAWWGCWWLFFLMILYKKLFFVLIFLSIIILFWRLFVLRIVEFMMKLRMMFLYNFFLKALDVFF